MSSSWLSAFTAEVKFSVPPISMWAPKHRRTWCIWSNFSNLTSGSRMHRHARVTKRLFGSNIFPHRPTGIQKREKIIWCVLTHSNTVTHTGSSHTSICWETQPLAGCATGSRALWKVFPWQARSALERYTTPPQEETEFHRMAEQFPLPSPWLWIPLPLRNQIWKINPSSQEMIFISSAS